LCADTAGHGNASTTKQTKGARRIVLRMLQVWLV
jgi:hypothetical protein